MKFVGKGRSLLKLKGIKGIKIPELILISYKEYLKNKNKTISLIKRKFKKKIAIRSSNISEDNLKKSNAGKFESIINVDTQNIDLVNQSIKKVFHSYKKIKLSDKIIVQNMVENVVMSGVVLTSDKDNSAPYITINYSESSKTSEVTSGKSGVKTFVYFKNLDLVPRNKKMQKILSLARTLIKKTNNGNIDIEFAIDNKNKIYLLQVRPIFIKKKIIDSNFIKSGLDRLTKKIRKLKTKNPGLFGNDTFFGTMPDWNPVEMLGSRPNPLAISLYKELITNDIWAKSRAQFGYRELKDTQLMNTFFGIPYIDLRVDFNSWLPKSLDTKDSEKLANYYLQRFKNFPHLHDKIEFEIIFSSYNFNTKKRLKNLKGIFNEKKIISFSKKLKTITLKTFEQCDLIENKIKVFNKKFMDIKNSNLYPIDKVYHLVILNKDIGTLNFANAARCGFVAVEYLDSFVKKNIINENEKSLFFKSLQTITKDLNSDISRLNKKKFLEKYGHLRPNTYDITSLNYRENYIHYFNKYKKSVKKNKFNFNNNHIKKIEIELKKNRIDIKARKLLSFIKKGIELREYTKYIFTRSLDYIFSQILLIAKRNRISRQDVAYLKINDILDLFNNVDHRHVNSIFNKEIKKNKEIFKFNKLVKLPDNIIKLQDLYYFSLSDTKINFVTKKVFSGLIAKVSSKNLSNKIVLIENADPGYDFIFTKKIGGLITKYGGVNSHMSIRCSEMGIPAAIGIGEQNFKRIAESRKVKLDCFFEKIDAL
jgi:phosphohistidine swiveling domain-containing protein